MALTVAVLGPVRVGSPDGVIEIDRPARRRLLSLLALARGSRVSTDLLIERFWSGDPPETARAAIQTHMSALRRQIGDGLVVTEGYGYRLNLDDHTLDTNEFAALVTRVGDHRTARSWEAALETIDSALALWRGDPFTELEDDEFARGEITRLDEMRIELLEARAEGLIALDRAEHAIGDLEALVSEHPLRERLWEHLMTARYRLGRRTEALRAFRDISDHLAEIGVEPGEPLRRLEERILLHDRSLIRTRHNLPVELDSFIGREREQRDIAELLTDNRLVTLTGAGGSGKTRLATRTARQVLDDYPDGVWYVELAPLADPDLIADELGEVIGLSPGENALALLERALSNDVALIVLDNCEHLLEGAATVARGILESAPAVKVIATSREPLRVPGEAVYDVPGLSVPDDDADAGPAESHDASRLFLHRARLARSSFIADDDDQESIADICRRLDGLPLAIELAAAQAATMPVAEISQRLDDRFEILTGGVPTGPPRHVTLEAAIDWSYRLLTDEERAVLHQLSVFRGGFDSEMAEQVCPETRVVPLLSGLISKSLVDLHATPLGRRYRLLETIRDFALLRLDESGGLATARDNHLRWCVGFASEVRRRLLVGPRPGAMDLVHLEADDLLSALSWAESRGRADDVGLISEVLAGHWTDLGRFSAAVRLLGQALAACDEPARKAHLHAQLSRALFWVGDNDRALAEARRGYELAGPLPSSPEKVIAICELAEEHMLEVDQDPGAALELAREALAVSSEVAEPLIEIRVRRELANALSWNGETAAGIREASTVLEMARGLDDSGLIVHCAQWLMHVQYMDPVARRDGPGEVLDSLRSDFSFIVDHPSWVDGLARGWVPWAMIQHGLFDELESILEGGPRHLESWELVERRILMGTLHWMQGRLDEAKDDLLAAEREGINPRWYHDYYPLRVDVLADRGELEEARRSADFYLNAEMHPTEEVKKVGVLNPLVRATVEAALSQPELREPLLARAAEDVARMESIITGFPQPIEGSISMETPPTHLALARAELSRATMSDPDLWRDAHGRADFLYFRLYAQWRLGEALLETGAKEEGIDTLAEARGNASRIGAELLLDRVDGTVGRFGVEIT